MPVSTCVFPVRYVAEGVAVQTTSCELTALGIAVRSLAPPQVGTRVSMALYLPDAEVPEVAVGRVSRTRAGSAGEAGFWADFVVVDAQARIRISNLLAGRSQPHSQARAFPRRPVHLPIRLRTERGLIPGRATNMSRGGIFIRIDDPPPVEAAVEVELHLPDGRPPVSSRGVVVHRRLPEPGIVAGAGVQFADASDAFRDRVDRYMEALIRA
ncbi:MAG TPA: PilZ domain-containing protein [Myxococcales bacterium]|nr:PilZ domain-containing protein [Myxococcales bacterium]